MTQPTEPARLTGPAPIPQTQGIHPAPLVLMYHSVDRFDEDPHLVTVSPHRFERQLAWLRARGLRGVGMQELLYAHGAGRARGLVGLTFDDGYADFATRALPVLLRYGFGATVFIVSGRIGEHNAWDTDGPDGRGPRKALMTAGQIRTVADAGIEIGSHGRLHVPLPDADDDTLRVELADSKAALEETLDRPVQGFAYPYGRAGEREVEAVRAAGYGYACHIEPDEPDRHALPRTYVGERDGALRLRAKIVRHALRRRSRV